MRPIAPHNNADRGNLSFRHFSKGEIRIERNMKGDDKSESLTIDAESISCRSISHFVTQSVTNAEK